jgi:hypothetical protein
VTARVLILPRRLDRRTHASSTPAEVVDLEDARREAGASARRLMVAELADVRRDLARAVLDEGRTDVLDAVRDLLVGAGCWGGT